MSQVVQEGQPAPEFALMGSEGKSVSLREYRGSWVVLYFYPKDNTPGCTIEAKNFRDNFVPAMERGVVLLGVSKDGLDSHRRFIDQHKLPFLLLSDPHGEVCRAYDAYMGVDMKVIELGVAARRTFLIDPQGNINKIWRSVDPRTHVKDVLALLDQVGAVTASDRG